jgi:hypothetical protein
MHLAARFPSKYAYVIPYVGCQGKSSPELISNSNGSEGIASSAAFAWVGAK